MNGVSSESPAACRLRLCSANLSKLCQLYTAQAELSDANSERSKMRQIVDEVLLLVCICMARYREVPTTCMRRFWCVPIVDVRLSSPGKTLSGNWFSCQAKLLTL